MSNPYGHGIHFISIGVLSDILGISELSRPGSSGLFPPVPFLEGFDHFPHPLEEARKGSGADAILNPEHLCHLIDIADAQRPFAARVLCLLV